MHCIKIRLALVFLICSCFTAPTSAGEFFWSASEFGQGAGPIDDFFFTQLENFPREIFLYYRLESSEDEIATSLDFDLQVVSEEFFGLESFAVLDAEIFNFDVVVDSNPSVILGQRWEQVEQPVIEGNRVTGFSALHSAKGGISGLVFAVDGSGVFLDLGYDDSNDAFLIASATVARPAGRMGGLSFQNLNAIHLGETVTGITTQELEFSGFGCLAATINDFLGSSIEMQQIGSRSNFTGFYDENNEPQLENTAGTIWYHFVPTADGISTARVIGFAVSGGLFDSQLHIFTGGELGIENLVPITNNNDAGGTVHSRVSFPVVAGQRYEVRVGAALDEFGNFQESCPIVNLDFLEGAVFGDLNSDGAVNLLDVSFFVALLAEGGYEPQADMNFDGNLNLLDVDGFIAALSQ